MTPAESDDLKQRVARLETALAQIQATLREVRANQLAQEPSIFATDLMDTPLSPTIASPPVAPQSPAIQSPAENLPLPASAITTSVQAPTPQRTPSDSPPAIQTWEFWLNRIGIGLLLLGVVFLFKYSIDQGWLTPAIRVGLGLVLGAGLIGLGLKLQAKRRTFSQVLIGGGLATFYITGFAAFQILQLVAYPIAFGFMVLVTLLGFFLSLQQNSAVLSVLAALGGLATPFLLYSESDNVTGLIGYTMLLLLGSGAIFWRQGWRSLIWTNFVAGWLILLAAVFALKTNSRMEGEIATQLGIAAAGSLFAFLPVQHLWRERRIAQRPAESAESAIPIKARAGELLSGLELMVFLTPLFTLWLSQPLWDSLPGRYWGFGLIGVSILYGLVGRYLNSSLPSLAYTHVLTSFLLLAIALVLLLEGDWLFLMLVAEAVILHLLADQFRNFKLRVAAHLLSAALGFGLVNRLAFNDSGSPAIFNLPSLINLATILASVGITWRLRSRVARGFYLVAAHIFTLAWLLREILPLGSGYVTLAWGFLGIALLILGLRVDQALLRWGGLATLLLVVFKLFVFDLTGLEPIWRILLFMGFGIVFLGLSYFFRNLWQAGRLPKTVEPQELSEPSEPPKPGQNKGQN